MKESILAPINDDSGQKSANERETLYEEFGKKQQIISEAIQKFASKNPDLVSSEEIKDRIKKLHQENAELNEKLFKKLDIGSEIYQKLIFNFNQIREAQKNVIWRIDETANLIIRDARNPAFPGKPEERAKLGTSEAYKIQILNVARAAELIISSDKTTEKEGDIAKIREKLKDYLGNSEKRISKEDVQSFNSKIVAFVADKYQLPLEEAGKRLNIAKEYTSFDDRHYSISTVYNLGENAKLGEQFVETDIALTEITRDQISKFGGIARESSSPGGLEDQKWFQDLDNFRQQMVRFQKEKIIDRQHVCPTQLRELPIIRNGYKKIISKINNQRENEEIAVHVHTGTHYVEAKDTSERRVLMQMVEGQQASFRNQEDMSVVCDLLSPSRLIPIDKKMSDAISELNRDNGVHLNLSQNIGRIISPRKTEAIDRIFDHIFTYIKADLKEDSLVSLTEYLKNGEARNKNSLKPEGVRARIDQLIENEDEKKVFNIMADIRILINEPTIIDLENKNLKIANKLEDLSNELKRLAEKPKDAAGRSIFGENIPKFEIVMQCKSGKDRTGVVELYNVANDIVGSIKLPTMGVNEVLGKIADLSNVVFLPGFQGGTPGCFGVKKEANTVFPRSAPESIRKMTMLETSKDNTLVYDEEQAVLEAKEYSSQRQAQSGGKTTNSKIPLIVSGAGVAASAALLVYLSMPVLFAGASLFSVAGLPIVAGIALMTLAMSQFELAKENYSRDNFVRSGVKFDKENSKEKQVDVDKEKIQELREDKGKSRTQTSFSPSSSVTAHKVKGKSNEEVKRE